MTYQDITHWISCGHYPKTRDFQQDLFAFAKAQGVTNERALTATFSQAWEIGHSNGYHEVLSIFEDLLVICKSYES